MTTTRQSQARISPVSARLFSGVDSFVEHITSLYVPKNALSSTVTVMNAAARFDQKTENTVITELGNITKKLTIILPEGWGELWGMHGKNAAVVRWSESPRGTYEKVVGQKIMEAASRLQPGLDYIPEHDLSPYELVTRIQRFRSE